MKTINRLFWCSVVAGAMFTSCDLDFAPTDSISASTLTEDDADNLVNGAYASINCWGMSYMYFIDEVLSDNMDNSFAPLTNGWYTDYDLLNVNGSSYRLSTIWENYYEAVQTCNNAITTLEESGNTAKAAQVRILRCWIYQRLVALWGKVPVLTEPTTELVGRDDEIKAWELMKEDCEYAIQHAPEYSSSLYVSKEAAEAMLARVLTIAPEGVRDYTNAAKYAEQVISSGKFALADDPNDIWLNKSSKEPIFELHKDQNDGSTIEWFLLGWQYELDSCANRSINVGAAANGRHMFPPDNALYRAFEEGDLRRDASIRDLRWNSDENGGGSTQHMDCIKYPNSTRTYADNLPILRIAEVYLLSAEAQGYPNGLGRLNELRAKRGLPALQSGTDVTADTWMSRIMQERRVELCFEGQRWYDLRRFWEMGYTKEVLALRSYQNGEAKGSRPTASDRMNVADDGHNLLLPVPTDETDINPNLGQNPGY